MAIICVVYNLLSAMQIFNDIYIKRACDSYFSMPVKRGTMYNAAFVYGVGVNACCFLLSTLFCAVSCYVNMYAGGKISADFSLFFANSFAVFAASTAALGVFILCAVSAGNKFQYIILCAIALFGFNFALNNSLTRFSYIWGMSFNYYKYTSISPLGNFISCINSKNISLLLVLSGISVIITLICYAAGYFVFNKRKAETAEISFSGAVPYILLFVLCAGVYMLLKIFYNFWILNLVGVILAGIAALIFSLVFFKKPFNKKCVQTYFASCIFSVIFLFIVYYPGYNSFISYVQEAQEIDIEPYNYYTQDISPIIYEYLSNDTSGVSVGWKITESESIEKFLNLHKKLVDKKTINKVKQKMSFSTGGINAKKL
ncbi:MAG: hypothetical protein LIO43_02130 [Clostridiales bacterium]|nr:hypothetical protein [Clostridiales bacterium]